MTSDREHVFVWVWLPGRTDPVVAGRIDRAGTTYRFTYGRSYLERSEAISLYTPELPLRRGATEQLAGLDIAGVLADAGPGGSESSWPVTSDTSTVTATRAISTA